jgi:hypothetical protein
VVLFQCSKKKGRNHRLTKSEKKSQTYEIREEKDKIEEENNPFMVYWNLDMLLEKEIWSTMELAILQRRKKKMATGGKKKKI